MMKVTLEGSDGIKRYLNVPILPENEKKILSKIDDNAGKIGTFNMLAEILDFLSKDK